MLSNSLGLGDGVFTEFTELQSGSRDDQRKLASYLDQVKKTNFKLLKLKLDRFSRGVVQSRDDRSGKGNGSGSDQPGDTLVWPACNAA